MATYKYRESDMTKNLYEKLGLKNNASQDEIKSSYRRLAKLHHPDAGGEKEKFIAIQYAWETLNDPFKKEQYDKTLFSLEQPSDLNNENWKDKVNTKKYNSTKKDNEVKNWIKNIYDPINKFLRRVHRIIFF